MDGWMDGWMDRWMDFLDKSQEWCGGGRGGRGGVRVSVFCYLGRGGVRGGVFYYLGRAGVGLVSSAI